MIVRGTTPTIRFQFKSIDPREMEAAFLTIAQDGVLIEKGLAEAEAYGDCLEWRLPGLSPSCQPQPWRQAMSRPRVSMAVL